MTDALTFVRSADFGDALRVVARMRSTERGQLELNCFALLGSPVDEESLSELLQNSAYTVALATKVAPGRPLVVAGFTPQRTGVFRTWMLATDEAWAEHGRELTTYTEAGIAVRLRDNAHRIETVCPDSHTRAKSWYPRLGLKQEATLAKFCTDGSDAALFVRLRGTA